ncbi:hypothetical protein ACWGJ9_09705 [Curtobacterium citreum]
MTATSAEFAIDDPVYVKPGLPEAKDLEGRVGAVIGFEDADRRWVVVLFDKQFSGRPDRGWLFTPGHLEHAHVRQQAA